MNKTDQIKQLYMSFMKHHIPADRKAVINLAAAIGVSESTIYRIIRKVRASCEHEWWQPYAQYGDPSGYTVCKSCWLEEKKISK
jgi:hypothetical protein